MTIGPPSEINSPVRTLRDLSDAVRVIARHFKTDTVFIIGSQGILLSWPDAPPILRTSGEIDAYPGNAKIWEFETKAQDPDDEPEASEEISTLFGWGSHFHNNHGFYIDGVDENTATLPNGWRQRSASIPIDVDGRSVLAVAPGPEDLIVSKLARLAEKDREFIEAYNAIRPLNTSRIILLVEMTDIDPAAAERAIAYVRSLTDL